MRAKHFLCLLLVTVTTIHAAKLGPFEILKNSAVKIDDMELGLVHFSNHWQNQTHDKGATLDGDFDAPVKGNTLATTGTFKVANGVFKVNQTFTLVNPQTLRYDCTLTSEYPIPTNELILAVSNPRLALFGFDTPKGRITFKRIFDGKDWAAPLPAPMDITFYQPNGTVQIKSNGDGKWQDERQFGSNRGTVRFNLTPVRGNISKATGTFYITYQKYNVTCLDLRQAANLGFRDKVEGDGKGGWTDQGPENDLKNPPKPGKHTIDCIQLEILDPAKNNGRSCIGLQSPNTPKYPVSATVNANNAQGKLLYLVHCVAWAVRQAKAGTIRITYQDGTTSSNDVIIGKDVANWWDPPQHANSTPVFLSVNDSASVGLHLSRFKIQDKPIDKIDFISNNVSCWMIVAASVGREDIPACVVRPVIFKPGKDWKVFARERDIKPGSLLDFSFLLDAPAGKYGRLILRDNHWVFEKQPDKPVRFWGGNTCFTCNFLTKEEAEYLADQVAAMGYNIIRFHHYDRDVVIRGKNAKNSTDLNLVNMDKLDYLVHALKKRGIYITLDFFTCRDQLKGEIEEAPNGLTDKSEFKALTYASESAYQNWLTFASNIMNHVNPYTKLAWKDDPAIVSVCLVNEGNIHSCVGALGPVSQAHFDKLFLNMAKERNWDVNGGNRSALYNYFLSETHRKGYARMTEALRKIGVKMLFTDQNMVSSAALSIMRQDYDYVDNHFYFEHPSFIDRPWSMPVLISHSSVSNKLGGRMANTFPTRLVDKPFAITEWDFCPPSHFATEGGMAIGAFAALQNWDMICRFAVSHSRERVMDVNSRLGYFDILNDTQRMLSERMGTFLFLRGDVKPATSYFVYKVFEEQQGTHELPGVPHDVMTKLGLIGLSASVVGHDTPLPKGTKAVFGNVPPSESKVKGVPYYQVTNRTTLPEILGKLKADGIITKEQYNAENTRFTSETGETVVDHKNNIFKVVTPKSEVFSLYENGASKGSFMEIKDNTTYGCFMATARDNVPLATSNRVLLMHLTESINALIRFRDNTMQVLEDWGSSEPMLKVGSATINLNIGENKKPVLYACSMVGDRMFQPPFTYQNGILTFKANNFVNGKPVFIYELLK